MKPLRTATVVAVALSALFAAQARASTVSASSPYAVVITAESPSVTSLYNGVALTTTSVTLGSALSSSSISGAGSISDVLGSLGSVHRTPGIPLLGSGGTGQGWVFAGGYSTRPIPEGRTALLYGAGLSLIGWAVLRMRGARRPD